MWGRGVSDGRRACRGPGAVARLKAGRSKQVFKFVLVLLVEVLAAGDIAEDGQSITDTSRDKASLYFCRGGVLKGEGFGERVVALATAACNQLTGTDHFSSADGFPHCRFKAGMEVESTVDRRRE